MNRQSRSRRSESAARIDWSRRLRSESAAQIDGSSRGRRRNHGANRGGRRRGPAEAEVAGRNPAAARRIHVLSACAGSGAAALFPFLPLSPFLSRLSIRRRRTGRSLPQGIGGQFPPRAHRPAIFCPARLRFPVLRRPSTTRRRLKHLRRRHTRRGRGGRDATIEKTP